MGLIRLSAVEARQDAEIEAMMCMRQLGMIVAAAVEAEASTAVDIAVVTTMEEVLSGQDHRASCMVVGMIQEGMMALLEVGMSAASAAASEETVFAFRSQNREQFHYTQILHYLPHPNPQDRHYHSSLFLHLDCTTMVSPVQTSPIFEA